MNDLYSIYLRRLEVDKYKITWPSQMSFIDRKSFIESLLTWCEETDRLETCVKLNIILENIKKKIKD